MFELGFCPGKTSLEDLKFICCLSPRLLVDMVNWNHENYWRYPTLNDGLPI